MDVNDLADIRQDLTVQERTRFLEILRTEQTLKTQTADWNAARGGLMVLDIVEQRFAAWAADWKTEVEVQAVILASRDAAIDSLTSDLTAALAEIRRLEVAAARPRDEVVPPRSMVTRMTDAKVHRHDEATGPGDNPVEQSSGGGDRSGPGLAGDVADPRGIRIPAG